MSPKQELAGDIYHAKTGPDDVSPSGSERATRVRTITVDALFCDDIRRATQQENTHCKTDIDAMSVLSKTSETGTNMSDLEIPLEVLEAFGCLPT